MFEKLKKYLAYQRKKRRAKAADKVGNGIWRARIPRSYYILGKEEEAIQDFRDNLEKVRMLIDDYMAENVDKLKGTIYEEEALEKWKERHSLQPPT